MKESLDLKECVSITFTIEDWAQIIAGVGMSYIDLDSKQRINSTIFDNVSAHARVLS